MNEGSLLQQFTPLANRVHDYFLKVKEELPPAEHDFLISHLDHDLFSDLTNETATLGRQLRSQLLSLAGPALKTVKISLMSSDADLHEARISLKKMEASLALERVIYREADVAHNEGEVLGFIRESEERYYSDPKQAERQFADAWRRLYTLIELAESAVDHKGETASGPFSSTPTREALRLERNRAFIIMAMDHEFDDTSDAVKEIFHRFEIVANRADNIEHEQKITDKILEQIRTSEFLFADLTSERPNVYYEIGFAHALGRRVILFCKKGTKRHFDLADYNCPEYENLRDLKEKLSRRLEALTNKKIR